MIAEKNATIKQMKLKMSKKTLFLFFFVDNSNGDPLINNVNNKATNIGIIQKKYLTLL